MAVKEFKRIMYDKLQIIIHDQKAKKKLNDVELATLLGSKSTQTVRNAFNIKEHVASDKVLTMLMKVLGVNGKVEWIEGVRYYSIKN